MQITYNHFRPPYLHSIFDYDLTTGITIWKERPRTDFSLSRRWKAWNNKHANHEAGNLCPTTGRLRVSLFEKTWYLDRLIQIAFREDYESVYHINGWQADNRLDNLTTERQKAASPTKYQGGDLYLTYDNLQRLVIHSGHHAFSFHRNKETAKRVMLELADSLQCGWKVDPKI